MSGNGNMVRFGGRDWRVLDARDGKALILSDTVMGKRPYHPPGNDTTWAECDMRAYLNGTFYQTFSPQDRARIVETTVMTDDNPWFRRTGGDATRDRIFLLSIEEVVRYFGDSGQMRDRNPNDRYSIDDQFNSCRVANDDTGTASWWWLRSPGFSNHTTAGIHMGGVLYVRGCNVLFPRGHIRPALWLTV